MVRVPTLRNILRVEVVLREAKRSLNKEEIKEHLPAKIPHSTLTLILDYLLASKKIIQTKNGISWVFEEGPQERMIIKEIEKTIEKRG